VKLKIVCQKDLVAESFLKGILNKYKSTETTYGCGKVKANQQNFHISLSLPFKKKNIRKLARNGLVVFDSGEISLQPLVDITQMKGIKKVRPK
jgi:hypothetical protein